MITKLTTQTRRSDRTGGAMRPWRWMAVGIGLVASVLLLVLVLFAGSTAVPTVSVAQPIVGRSMVVTAPVFDGTRYKNVPVAIGNPSSQDLWGNLRTQATKLAEGIGLGSLFPKEGMQSSPLGIDAPQGVDLRDLPTGLTDYIRPSSITPIAHTQSAPLGIDAPQGVDLRDLPTGLTDYIRHKN